MSTILQPSFERLRALFLDARKELQDTLKQSEEVPPTNEMEELRYENERLRADLTAMKDIQNMLSDIPCPYEARPDEYKITFADDSDAGGGIQMDAKSTTSSGSPYVELRQLYSATRLRAERAQADAAAAQRVTRLYADRLNALTASQRIVSRLLQDDEVVQLLAEAAEVPDSGRGSAGSSPKRPSGRDHEIQLKEHDDQVADLQLARDLLREELSMERTRRSRLMDDLQSLKLRLEGEAVSPVPVKDWDCEAGDAAPVEPRCEARLVDLLTKLIVEYENTTEPTDRPSIDPPTPSSSNNRPDLLPPSSDDDAPVQTADGETQADDLPPSTTHSDLTRLLTAISSVQSRLRVITPSSNQQSSRTSPMSSTPAPGKTQRRTPSRQRGSGASRAGHSTSADSCTDFLVDDVIFELSNDVRRVEEYVQTIGCGEDDMSALSSPRKCFSPSAADLVDVHVPAETGRDELERLYKHEVQGRHVLAMQCEHLQQFEAKYTALRERVERFRARDSAMQTQIAQARRSAFSAEQLEERRRAIESMLAQLDEGEEGQQDRTFSPINKTIHVSLGILQDYHELMLKKQEVERLLVEEREKHGRTQASMEKDLADAREQYEQATEALETRLKDLEEQLAKASKDNVAARENINNLIEQSDEQQKGLLKELEHYKKMATARLLSSSTTTEDASEMENTEREPCASNDKGDAAEIDWADTKALLHAARMRELELTESNNDLHKQLLALNAKQADSLIEIESLQSKLESSNHRCTGLMHQLGSATTEHEEHLESLRTELREAHAACEDAKMAVEAAKRNYEKSDEKAHRLSVDLQTVKDERTRLKGELTELRLRESRSDGHAAEQAVLERKLVAAEEQLERRTNELSQLKDSYTQLNEAFDRANVEMDALRSNAAYAQQERQKMLAEVALLRDEKGSEGVVDLATHEKMCRQRDEEIEMAQKQMDRMQAELVQIDDLKDLLHQSKQQLVDVEQVMDSTIKEKEHLSKQLQDLAAQHGEMAQRLEDIQKEFAQWREDANAQYNDVIGEYEEKLDMYRSLLQKYVDYPGKKPSLSSPARSDCNPASVSLTSGLQPNSNQSPIAAAAASPWNEQLFSRLPRKWQTLLVQLHRENENVLRLLDETLHPVHETAEIAAETTKLDASLLARLPAPLREQLMQLESENESVLQLLRATLDASLHSGRSTPVPDGDWNTERNRLMAEMDQLKRRGQQNDNDVATWKSQYERLKHDFEQHIEKCAEKDVWAEEMTQNYQELQRALTNERDQHRKNRRFLRDLRHHKRHFQRRSQCLQSEKEEYMIWLRRNGHLCPEDVQAKPTPKARFRGAVRAVCAVNRFARLLVYLRRKNGNPPGSIPSICAPPTPRSILAQINQEQQHDSAVESLSTSPAREAGRGSWEKQPEEADVEDEEFENRSEFLERSRLNVSGTSRGGASVGANQSSFWSDR